VPLKTLFLDAGGVLVFPNWQRVSDVLAAHGVRADAAALAAADPHARRRIDSGEQIASTTDHQRSFPYFNLVLECAGVPQNEATDAALAELHAYHAAHNLWEYVPPDVPPAIARFRAIGLKLVVVSNSNGTIQLCLNRAKLAECFELMLDSAQEGIEKPDPALFRRALDRSGSRPETTMHVGDLYHVDVIGARRAGIKPVLLDPLGLYPEADCLRVRSLGELADILAVRRT